MEHEILRQQSQAVLAWTLGRPRDSPGKHERLAELLCVANKAQEGKSNNGGLLQELYTRLIRQWITHLIVKSVE